MTVWEFHACMDGLRIFYGGKRASGGDISEDQLAAMGIEGFE